MVQDMSYQMPKEHKVQLKFEERREKYKSYLKRTSTSDITLEALMNKLAVEESTSQSQEAIMIAPKSLPPLE